MPKVGILGLSFLIVVIIIISFILYYYTNSDRIAKKNSSGVFYYHSDHLGSTSVVTSSSGSLVEKTKYAPFGAVLSGGSEKYGYTGQERDDTGLMYYHARYYDPALMRFVEADPVVQDVYDPQGLNRYSYVRNNPMKLTDPKGESFEDSVDYYYTGGFYQYGSAGPILCLASIFEQNRQRMWSEDYKNNPQLQQEYKNAATVDLGIVKLSFGNMADGIREDPLGFLGKVAEGAMMAYTAGGAAEWLGGRIAADGLTKSGISLLSKEASTKEIASKWGRGTFDSVKSSLEYHFKTHASELGVKTELEYTNKAATFFNINMQSAKSIVLKTGERGLEIIKGDLWGRYTLDGMIISFGKLKP